jgi:hypothetical protein
MIRKKLNKSPFIYFKDNPLIDLLTDNWKVIRHEFYALLKGEFNFYPDKATVDKVNPEVEGYSGQHKLYLGKFNSVPLYLKREMVDDFEAKEWPREIIEKTYDRRVQNLKFLRTFIEENKSVMGGLTFNISFPGSTLNHHFGLTPDYLRIHLCIKEDPNCVFDIENWKTSWREGTVFGFDDAHVLHGTKHYLTETSTSRIIMLLDIKKDYLKPYATSWPCRGSMPTKEDMPELDGWVENGINLGTGLFVKDWPKHIGIMDYLKS